MESILNLIEALAKEVSELKRVIFESNYLTRNEKNKDADDLLCITEAAELLNLSVPTIYSMVSKKKLHFMKKAKRLYFSKQELISYIKSGRCQTEKELMANPESLILKRKGGK